MRPLYIGNLALLLCFYLSSNNIYAGVFPDEGAQLNYRIIGFSFPSMPECSTYTIEIDTGRIFDASQFNAINTPQTSASNRIIAEVPEFGTDYTWRILYSLNDGKTATSDLYHFSTLNIPLLPGDIASRLRVTQNNNNYADHYVFVDGANIMYDMNGSPVWFYPQIDGVVNAGLDIKCTPQHTITLLCGAGCYEINYDGKMLWKGPDLNLTYGITNLISDKVNIPYHHEMTRLANGHYMALGNLKPGNKEIAPHGQKDNLAPNNKGGHFFPNTTQGSALYEYDSSGNLIWKWNSGNSISHSDIGNFYADLFEKKHLPFYDAHENSFYFDEKNNTIYLSYAMVNRVIAISYPSGKVINTYGKIYDTVAGRNTLSSFDASTGGISIFALTKIFNNHMFCGQHTCGKTKDGNLIMYNNNMFNSTALPQVLIFKEVEKNKAHMLKKVWQFNCPVDSLNIAVPNGGGGSVYEMNDSLLLVTMNSPYKKIFIVNKNKEILWSAIPENRTPKDEWQGYSPYRSSIIDRAELEQLIWKSEADN